MFVLLLINLNALHADEQNSWKVYIKNGAVQEFIVSEVADNGIMSADGKGISFNVIDSIVVSDSTRIEELLNHFDEIRVVQLSDAWLLDISKSSRTTRMHKKTDSFLVRTRTQFFSGKRTGISLDYKRHPDSHFLWRIDGGMTKEDDEMFPLGFDYGIGPGLDYWGSKVGVSIAVGYMVYNRLPDESFASKMTPAGFVNPNFAIKFGREGMFHLAIGWHLSADKLWISRSDIHSGWSLGVGWNQRQLPMTLSQ